MTAGAAMATPTELAIVINAGDRHEVLGLLIQGVGAPRSQRLATSKLLHRQCLAAASLQSTSTNHLLASMAGSVYSVLLYHDDPYQAQAVALSARRSAEAAGHNGAQLWAASAEAMCARRLGDPRGAIEAIESVMNLRAERGTRGVLAASVLAESYGDTGDAAGVQRSLEQIARVRDSITDEDEFSGMMYFAIEEQLDHQGEALLGCRKYAEAITHAGRSLEIYDKMPAAQRSIGYMRNSCVTVATAATRLGWLDQAEEYARRALAFPVDRPLEPVFMPLQQALATSNVPRLAAHIREAVQSS
ncbi:MAG: hypothetical protein AAF449_00495 [Myxococcota bacterium]